MNYLRNLLLTLTAVGAVLSFYIKVCRDFFIETVKSNYKNVPGKQSIFEIIVKWAMYSLFILDGVVILLFILTKGEILFENITNTEVQDLWLKVFSIVILIFCSSSLICTLYSFYKVKRYFIDKLEDKYKKTVGIKTKIWIYISMAMSLIVFLVGSAVIILNIYIKVTLVKEGRNFIFINSASKDDINNYISWVAISFVCLTIYIILNSINEFAKTINENCTYIILTDAEDIVCNSYLEYNECYLVFRNGVQRYISKSKVKEINKSTYYYKQDINLKA